MGKRLWSKVLSVDSEPASRHFRGLPPELTSGVDTREKLGRAAYLVIEQKPDGVFLERFDERGEPVGDTWHRSIPEAEDQARHEFGNTLTAWEDIPMQTTDEAVYCLGLRQSKAE